jgi:hypothetical protein
MRIARALVAASLLIAGCTAARPATSGPSRPSWPASAPSGSATPVPVASVPPAVYAPHPDAPLPADAAGLSAALVKVTRALHGSIDRWRAEGSTLEPPPEEVVLQALYQQRLYRAMGQDPKLSAAAIARLPGWLQEQARSIRRAASLLSSLVRPISKPTAFKTGPPRPAGELLRYYRRAERRFGIAWEVLAALNHVESKFGRVKSTSYAGAQGPMQFIPSTWAVYGMGGDVNDPHDAIMGAANYLHRSGAPADYRRALHAYNHAWPYVDAILLYAQWLRRDVRNYFAFYNWQVYVQTTNGPVRITGPGLP